MSLTAAADVAQTVIACLWCVPKDQTCLPNLATPLRMCSSPCRATSDNGRRSPSACPSSTHVKADVKHQFLRQEQMLHIAVMGPVRLQSLPKPAYLPFTLDVSSAIY